MIEQTQTLNWIKDKFKDSQPLTLQEEYELFTLIRDENKPEIARNSAKALVLSSNMKFVIQVAQRYYNDTLTTEELINEGAIGLWRAEESFDHTRGIRFITYAVWWIKAFIARAISEKGALIRLPLNQQAKLHKEIRNCPNKKDLDSSLQELDAIGGRQVSLSTETSPDGTVKLEDVIEDKEQTPIDKAVEDELLGHFTNKLLSKLPLREQQILSQMYGLGGKPPRSIREISHRLGLSRERIRQLRDQAVTRLRNLNCDGHLDQTLQEYGCNCVFIRPNS